MNGLGNNLLVAASGTGGHIFPALSIAERVDKDWNVSWLGIKNRCEEKLVPKKYNLYNLKINSPRGNYILLIFTYLRIIFAAKDVIKIIKKNKISLIFTTGGYISAPAIIAGKIMKIPVILHESNLIPGLVTKYFGRYCDSVLLGFKETNKYLKNCKIIFTGTPLRNQFYIKNKIPTWIPKGNGPLILIMGGSQGAKGINELIYSVADFLISKNFRLIHITGESENIYYKNKKLNNYILLKFSEEIAALMQNCDLVISRSGSGAVNEIIETKIPSILIPYPNSKNNHQEQNALFLSSLGCSILINEKNISKDYFQKTLTRIFYTEFLNKENNRNSIEIIKANLNKINFKDPRYQIKNIINFYKKEL